MKKLLFITVLLLIPATSFAAMPDFPMSFWGTVTADETVVPAGSIVRVYDDVVKVGEVVVQEAGVYGYTEPTKQKLVVGEGNGSLTFTIQSPSINSGIETEGLSSIAYAGFVSGETIQKDLSFELTEEVVVSSGSGGGSSSSGGGGGSSRKKVVEPTELILGVSTSTLSEEEQKIVLQKKLIEVLTILVTLLKQKLLL